MCAVSAVYDYGYRFPIDTWTPYKFEEFKKLIDSAKDFDEKTNQPNCEDPEKAKLLKIIEKQLQDIKDKLNTL